MPGWKTCSSVHRGRTSEETTLALVEAVRSTRGAAFEQRMLDFDQQSARLYAEVMGRRKAIGRPLSVLDGQIASIARANDLAVATRNIRDFEECGLDLINPFDSTRSTE